MATLAGNTKERVIKTAGTKAEGRWLLNGTGAPTAIGSSAGLVVTRTGVGDFTVTLDEKIAHFGAVHAAIVLAAESTTDNNLQMHTMAVASNVGTFKLTLKTSADVSATDYAPADLTSDELHLIVHYYRDDIPGSN